MSRSAEYDPHEAPFWEAVAEHRLVLQKCSDCNRFQHYPRPICLACRGNDLHYEEVSGQGTIYASTTVFRSPDPETYSPPYVVALIELDEGPRMMSNVVGGDGVSVQCGQRVTVRWREEADSKVLPVFTPLSD